MPVAEVTVSGQFDGIGAIAYGPDAQKDRVFLMALGPGLSHFSTMFEVKTFGTYYFEIENTGAKWVITITPL